MSYLELQLKSLEVFHIKTFKNILDFFNIFIFFVHDLKDLIFDLKEFL
jgi:hypothetical protein